MDLAINEMKVQNAVPTLSQQEFFWLGSERAKQGAQVNLHNYTNQLCCNVFCYPAEWFIYFTKLYTNIKSSKQSGRMGKVWHDSGVAIKSPYIYGHFQ